MSSRSSAPFLGRAVVSCCLVLAGMALAVAVLCTSTAQASFYKLIMCAQTNDATGAEFSTSPGAPFTFHNQCPASPNFPAGDPGFLRIAENTTGTAGVNAFGRVTWTAPGFVAIAQAGGFTREPNAFNDGWRARFWTEGFDGSQNNILMQGAGVVNNTCGGVCWATTSTFNPHLWPFPGFGFFHRFSFELLCVRPGGCDRTNFNAAEANTMILTLNDVASAVPQFDGTNPNFISGAWVRGPQVYGWNVTELGSGLRWERARIDGRQVFQFDHRNGCNLNANAQEGEFARVFQPCPVGGPFARAEQVDTATLADGPHTIQVCAQDFGQAVGLAGTASESCDQRTVHVDNHAPSLPGALVVTSPNSARYTETVGARWTLPPDPGSPITKVHYEIVDAADKVVVPEKTISATNPTEIKEIAGPRVAGDYRLRVWLEDTVGLAGPKAVVAIPRDTTPPAAPQEVSVTSPNTSRKDQGFDVRWRNISDNGAPIDAAHYQVLDAAGRVLDATETLNGSNPQAIASLKGPKGIGTYILRLWLSDAEGNVGAPIQVPLSYECGRSEVGGGVSLSAGLGEKGDRLVVVPQGKGSTVRGSLSGAGGPVANAALCVFGRVITDEPREYLGTAMTGADGSYNFALPAGPSREVTTMYRGDQRQIAARATIHTRVKPTLKLGRKVVHNHHYATFSGEIPGPHNDKVVVVVQVKHGKGWRAVRRYRTRNGHYNLKYLFTQTDSATVYVLRTQVRETAGYPFVQGNSRPVRLRVLP